MQALRLVIVEPKRRDELAHGWVVRLQRRQVRREESAAPPSPALKLRMRLRLHMEGRVGSGRCCSLSANCKHDVPASAVRRLSRFCNLAVLRSAPWREPTPSCRGLDADFRGERICFRILQYGDNRNPWSASAIYRRWRAGALRLLIIRGRRRPLFVRAVHNDCAQACLDLGRDSTRRESVLEVFRLDVCNNCGKEQ